MATTTAAGKDIRVRFCPSPTGTPHVGMVRTCLFNWAYARHTGGTFVFRIEDTDAQRDSEESYQAILESLKWLGLDWDEGIGVGGPHGPYRQSERGEIYQEVAKKLFEAGYAYESFSTPEEVRQRHIDRGENPELGYDGFDRDLTEEQKEAFQAEGRKPSLRIRMPDEDLTFDDLVRGEITYKAGTVPDYVIVRGNGDPLYTLTNPVDDAMMGITHVLRGEDILSSTPRQLVLYRALEELGIAKFTPRFGHLPYVMGEGNKKLSKRDPESNLFLHRDRGIIPEGMINYLALLGWSLSADRDVFSREELVENFDIADVNGNPARFDNKKCTAINADHIRMLEVGDFTRRIVSYVDALSADSYDELSDSEREVLAAAAPLAQTRIQVLSEANDLLRFLFIDGEQIEYDDKAVRKLKDSAPEVLRGAREVLSSLDDVAFTPEELKPALDAKLVDEMEIKPRLAYGPLFVAMTGTNVSIPVIDSIGILGKSEALARIDQLLAKLEACAEA